MANVQKLTQENKDEIIRLINDAAALLGGHSAVAEKCGVSPATISLMKDNQYVTKGDDMWLKIATRLNWRPSGWQTAETTNLKVGLSVLADAQRQSLFLRISENAGSGKSTFIDRYQQTDGKSGVYIMECRDLKKREFLLELARQLGIGLPNAHQSCDNILMAVIGFFEIKKGKPLLIIDQANDIPESALSCLVTIYNRLKYRLGLVLVGTEELRVKFERGIKANRKSYDEVDSRFGRTFIPLPGNTINDTRRICAANGIEDKSIQAEIFDSCRPVHKTIENDGQLVSIKVITDGRLIERAIIRYHLLTALTN